MLVGFEKLFCELCDKETVHETMMGFAICQRRQADNFPCMRKRTYEEKPKAEVKETEVVRNEEVLAFTD